MNTRPSFSSRYNDPTHMHFSRVPNVSLILRLVVAMLISGSIHLSAQEQPARKAPAEKSKNAATAKTPKRRQRPADALRESRGKLQDLVPFQDEIVETIVVRGKRFQATGKYMQGQDKKLRLEFQLEVGRTKGSLIQVCDGTTLFTQQKIGLIVLATKRNVPRILKEMKQLAAASGPRPQPGQFEADLGLGGLEALLGSLEQSMSFNRRREQSFQGRPFIIIEGTWNASFLQTLTDDDRPVSDELPEYVPDRVRVYIDKATQFPHRVVYLKKVPGRQVLKPMVSLEFRNVKVNVRLADTVFSFKPAPGVPVTDNTDEYLRQMRQSQSTAAGAEGGAPSRPGGSAPARRPGSR